MPQQHSPEAKAFVAPDYMRPSLQSIAPLAADAGVDVWIVGGTVRDTLLGRSPRDLDIAVRRDALPFARRLADSLHGRYVELDNERFVARVVPSGRVESLAEDKRNTDLGV